MSAIWGIIDLENKNIEEPITQEISKPYKDCVLDRVETIKNKNVFMSCGIQYFTEVAEYERLPVFDKEKEIYFNADVVLDNRNELCRKIGIEDKSTLPDGEVLYKLITKLGNDCLNDIAGLFSLVHYDRKNETITLAIDATGNRCLYYRVTNGRVYFSTLLTSLTLIPSSTEINERWICDFLALDNLLMVTETEETSLSNVFRVAPGQVVTIKRDSIDKKYYWNPIEDVKDLKLKSDDEYKRMFLEKFNVVVNDIIRKGKSDIGILLSGGMDSTAVATIASPILKKNNKKLIAYTSVPEGGYVSNFPSNRITNESDVVLNTSRFLGNVECNFIDLNEENAWVDRLKHMKYLEMPFKHVQNLMWMNKAMEMAYQRNIRNVLTGGDGNNTISFSNLELYMHTLYSKKRYLKLWKELKCFQKKYGYSIKWAVKDIINRNKINESLKRDRKKENSYLRQGFSLANGSFERINQIYEFSAVSQRDYTQFKKLLTDRKKYRQIGEIETKESLITGVLLRDPTKDKRMIEFCLSLPIDQFIKNGEERRLVDVYMKDIMPTNIVKDRDRGKQSADLVYKISKQWESIREEWIRIYMDHEENRIIDVQRALKDLSEKKNISDYKEFDIVRHIYTILTLEYMDQLSSKTN